jgi:hypothetical protein
MPLGITVGEVLEMAERAAEITLKTHSILVFEWNAAAWNGLQRVVY